MKTIRRMGWIAAFLGAAFLGGLLATSFAPRSAQAAALAGFGPQVKVTLFDVPNISTNPDEFPGLTPVKVADVGTFTVENSASLVEVTHNGRLFLDGLTNANGVYFELRVDNANGMVTSSGQSSGLALLRASEVNTYLISNFSGYWQDLPAGNHTVSIWVRTLSNSGLGDNALLDPGGFATNVVIVKEYLPFGATYMPAVTR